MARPARSRGLRGARRGGPRPRRTARRWRLCYRRAPVPERGRRESEAPPASNQVRRGRYGLARPRLAAAGPIRPRRPPPRPGSRCPPARAHLLTDFKAERKRPNGPERRRARATPTTDSSSTESAPSGTNARGRGEGRAHAPPGTDHPAPPERTEGRGLGLPGAAAGPALRAHRRLTVLCPGRYPCPGAGVPLSSPFPGVSASAPS